MNERIQQYNILLRTMRMISVRWTGWNISAAGPGCILENWEMVVMRMMVSMYY